MNNSSPRWLALEKLQLFETTLNCPFDARKEKRGLGTLAKMKRLIINADDFGLAPGVNRAIVELQQAGALSSTTLMATAAYFSPAVFLAFAQPTLAVGCHVVLVDGSPRLRPSEVPSLLDPRQSFSFRNTVGSFLSDLLRGRIREQEIEAEAIAQIQRIQSSGLTVSHIDSHKHLHAFPRVLAPLLRAARHCGVDCVRNPFEPWWSLRATRTGSTWRRTQVHAMRTQQAIVFQADHRTRHDHRRWFDRRCWLLESLTTRCCVLCFTPCLQEHGSWFVIRGIATVRSIRHVHGCGPRAK